MDSLSTDRGVIPRSERSLCPSFPDTQQRLRAGELAYLSASTDTSCFFFVVTYFYV